MRRRTSNITLILNLFFVIFSFLFFFPPSVSQQYAQNVGDCRCQNTGQISPNNGIECYRAVPGEGSHWKTDHYCATNEVCTGTVNNYQCTVPSGNNIVGYTCDQKGQVSPNNGIDAKEQNGTVVQNYKYCPSSQVCDDSSGTATCVNANCTCDHPDLPGSGNNTMTCKDASGNSVGTACSLLQVCTGAAGQATCKQMACTCDYPSSTIPGQNTFVCGNTNGSCQQNEICTGAAGQATCQQSSQAGRGVLPTVPPPPPPCAQFDSNGQCTQVNTFAGIWGTDPKSFVTNLFSILLSISGTVALLIIMFAGYRLLASQGDPEKIQAAREQITAAIVGLLFIIFSFVILQIIGVDILQIPGFGTGSTGTGTGGSTGTGTGTGVGGGRVDYGNDANPCAALVLGANCGLNAGGSGLFCAGSCGVGGLGDTLYQCVKSGNGYTTAPVKDCFNAGQICLTGNGANVPDYCGAKGSSQSGGP